MMRHLLKLLAGILAAVTVCNAQGTYVYRSDNPVRYPPGRYEISGDELDFVGHVISLNQLIQGSDLIIDGTVAQVLPSVRRDPKDPMSLDTFSVISVKEVIRGELSDSKGNVTLVQMGGSLDGYEFIVRNDPLVKPGERYILFLQADNRQKRDNVIGVPRYYVVGHWSGRARVNEQGWICFLPSAVEALHSFDRSNVSLFIALLKDRINFLYGPGPPHPTGIPGPPPPGVPLPPTGPPQP